MHERLAASSLAPKGVDSSKFAGFSIMLRQPSFTRLIMFSTKFEALRTYLGLSLRAKWGVELWTVAADQSGNEL